MTNATISPTEPPSFPTHSVGLEDGDHQSFGERVAVLEVPKLETPVEWMRWCGHCESEQCFFAEYFSLEGLIGSCQRCGSPAVAEYTRMNSEVA